MDIQHLKSLKVLVIGDYCTDVFKYGTCERLSPEAPVPVFSYKYSTKTDGMAGNVVNNLKSFGVYVTLKTSCNEAIKERLIDIRSKQHLLRIDYEQKAEPIRFDSIENLQSYDAIIISDYNKGSIDNLLVQQILHNFQKPIFVDSKKNDLSIFENCIIKINESEFKNLTKTPKKCKLIVTIGEQGAKYEGVVYPAQKVQTFDVSGAGDSFIAGLCVQYLLNTNLELAIKFANTCASNVVTKTGTAAIVFNEVKDELCF